MSTPATVAADRRNLLLAAIAGLILGAILMRLWATPAATGDRATTEAVVRDYLLAHPEILPQAMEVLRARDTGRAIDANRVAIETPYKGAWAGAADGDVVLVEFFDYACGYCRQSVADIDRLLAEDKRLKVVFRDLPVLGPPSEAAARASLAAAGGRERFARFHRALFAAGRPTDAAIAAAATQAGVTPTDDPAIERELTGNLAMASGLGINGTPAFIVGRRLMSGAVGYDALKAAIAEARAAR